MTVTSLLDVARFANFVGRGPDDDAVWFAVEMAEGLIIAEIGTVSDPVPPALSAVAFSVAARLLAGPVGVANEGEGGTSFGYKIDAGTLQLTPAEQLALHRVVGRYGGLGMIALTTPGAGNRRFDPGPPHRPYNPGR